MKVNPNTVKPTSTGNAATDIFVTILKVAVLAAVSDMASKSSRSATSSLSDTFTQGLRWMKNKIVS